MLCADSGKGWGYDSRAHQKQRAGRRLTGSDEHLALTGYRQMTQENRAALEKLLRCEAISSAVAANKKPAEAGFLLVAFALLADEQLL